ncbi:MAG TPA: hypothetical protein DDX85_01145 [Nitrospiraceae bacterium]|nr:hypothetical protein [Nitrospiraceae bacterium]
MVGIDKIINDVTIYLHANQAGSIAAGVIMLFLLIKKPKLFFILLALCIVGIGFMQVFDKLSASGITEKEFGSLQELK